MSKFKRLDFINNVFAGIIELTLEFNIKYFISTICQGNDLTKTL